MDILFITAHYHPIIPFGAALSSKLICEYLEDKGHNLNIFVHDKEERKKEYEKHGLEDIYKGRNVKFGWGEDVYSDIQDGDYDIIHQYGGKYKGRIAYKFRNFAETKVVTTLNGPTPPLICKGKRYDPESRFCCRAPKDIYCSAKSDFWGERDYKYNPVKGIRDYIKYKVDKHVLRYYDRLFPQSQWLSRLFEKSGVPSEKLKVIPNFYDPNFFERVKKAKNLNLNKDGNIEVLYVGRIIEAKGVMHLLKAFRMIESDEVRLTLLGSGELEEDVREFIQKNDLDQVNFEGLIPYEDIHKCYLRSDVFVHPCKYPTEAFNRTLTEAALAKNAMLVSDAGTSPEIVGEDGLVYEKGDIEDLAGKLKMLIEDENLREGLKDKIYEKVRKRYSIDNVMKMVEEEYFDLIGE